MKWPSLPASLRGRLALTFVGVIVVAMLALAAVVPGLARAHQVAALENRLADEAQVLADYVLTELDQGRQSDLDALAKRLGRWTETRFTIIALDGTVVGESHQDLTRVGNHAGRREVQQALAQGRGADLHHSETVGYDMLYVAVPVVRDGAAIGTARASLPLSEVDRLVSDLTRAFLVASAASGLLAIAVAFFAARAVTLPLARLTRQAAILADDPLQGSGILHGTGPSEVIQLGVTLDRLATAVRESLQRVGTERDRLDAVLANLADGVVLIDAQRRVIQLNPAARRLLGFEERAVSGRTLVEVLRDHELAALVERAPAGADGERSTTAFLEWRNPRRFLRAAVSRFGAGESAQTLLVLQDLTELRRLETVRRDFVANVSHELRTPITAIKAMTETLQDGAIDDSSIARDFVRRIEQEVDGLHQLVEELLELSRLESGRVDMVLTPVDAVVLIENVVDRLMPMAGRAQVALTVDVPRGLPKVRADPERMRQVLVNLLHNAIKFTPEGGDIVVRAKPDNGRVQISVADTGIGIEPELLPRVFERFYKADQARSGGGTGLGLAIAKHTVQLHSGEIWAESAGPGHGTTVHVRLPCAAAIGSAP